MAFLLSGHNVDSELTPVYRRKGRSFFTPPLRIVDTGVILPAGGLAVDVGFRFESNGDLNYKDENSGIANPAPNQPQWSDPKPIIGGDYAIRFVDLSGNYILTNTFADGNWYRLNTVIFPEFTYTSGAWLRYAAEIGPWPVDGTILARAFFRMEIL